MQHALLGAYLAAIDVDGGAAEDVALRAAVHVVFLLLALEEAFAAPVVVAAAAAEDVAHDVAAVEVDVGLAALEDGCGLGGAIVVVHDIGAYLR